jgi:hypothetical protein
MDHQPLEGLSALISRPLFAEIFDFKFLNQEASEIQPGVWLDCWAARYEDGDNKIYFDLIAKQGRLSGDDFELIGKWKEGCLKPDHGSWKTGTPKAYDVWMLAKAELPSSPWCK